MLLPALALSCALSSPAVAVSISGHVEVDTGSKIETVHRFDELPEGSTIITHEGAFAQLRMASGSLLKLGPRTRVNLKRLVHKKPRARRKETVKLVVGRLWARVTGLFGDDSDFEVETANAVAGVRGTSFLVESEDGKDKWVLTAGAMELEGRSGARMLLDAPGSFVDASGTGFSTPATLGADKIALFFGRVGGSGGQMIAQLGMPRLWTGTSEGGVTRYKAREIIVGPADLIDNLLRQDRARPVTDPPPSEVDVTIRVIPSR